MFHFFKSLTKQEQSQESYSSNSEPQIIHIAQAELEFPIVETIPTNNQQIFRGSQKQFSENINLNISHLAKRLPDNNLLLEKFQVGTRSQRKVGLIYLKDRSNPHIVSEIRDRIQAIKAETLLDSSYLERNIENSNISPFPQIETTTRPDVAESALLQGRVVIIVDDCPDVLIAPTTFFDLMDTPEDSFERWFIAASFFRIARYIMFIFATSLPALYIALSSFNPELIPTNLLCLMAAYTETTPFPVYFETFFMMGIVEAVRMMLIRMPSSIGSTIALFAGITLVIAGLASQIISIPVTIIVTLTIICSFSIPNFDLRLSVRIIQFFTMLMATFLGVFGFAVAFFFITIHLVTLKSFGIPYMTPLAPLEPSGWGHTILRQSTEQMPLDETYQPQKNK